MRSFWAAGFLLRRLRSEAGVVLLLVALVAATSFLFSAAPRLFNLAADGALVHELRAAPVVERNVQLALINTLPAEWDIAELARFGRESLDGLPPSLRSLIAEQHGVVTTPRFEIVDPPRYPAMIALRYQDGLEGAITLVDGRLPSATGDQLPPAQAGFGQGPLPDPGPTAARFEIAISEAAAAEVGVAVGDRLRVELDTADPVVRSIGVSARAIGAELDVVGIFAVADPEADVWYADRALERPDIGGSDENPIALVTALVAPDAYPGLVTSGLPFRYAWRYFVEPERADVGQLDILVDELKQLQSQGGFADTPQPNQGFALGTGLLGVLEAYQAERAASEAVLSVAAIGPFALAAGAIAMLGLMLVVRRRASLELTRSRGASGLLLLAAQLWEGTLLAGGAALLGLLITSALVPGRASGLSPMLAVATAVAAATVLVGATWPTARHSLGRVGREDPPIVPTSPRRLVLELTVVGLAVAGVLLLRQRGLVIGDGTPGEIVRFDPFLAAVPVLAGLAVGLVAMRLYPLPIRAFGWLAAGRRDLVPVLGLRTVGRHAAAANLPLLVLMLTAAFGAFASVVLSSIDRGQAEVAYARVGADYRVEVALLGSGALIDPAQLSGVDAVAAGYVDQTAAYAEVPGQRSRLVFLAVDPAAYSEVLSGSSIDPRWPTGFSAAATTGLPGTPESPIPAIVSDRAPAGGHVLGRGDTFTVLVGVRQVTFAVIQKRSSFPGVRDNAPFVVASFGLLEESLLDEAPPPSVLFVRGSEEIGAQLRATVAERSPSSAVTSRYEAYASLRAAPFVAMVTDGFKIALAVTVLYATLAIIGALTLTASRRSQDLSFLRTLGLSARQALGLTVVEHGPPVVLALVPGVALGIWIAALLAPGLGLAAFIGPNAVFALDVAWAQIVLLGLGLVMMVVAAGAASTLVARRRRSVDALRLGGE